MGSPAQQDEADIVAESGAERDESGELLTDEASILKLGAVDADSVRENRRLEHIVNQKRAGEKDVPFNAGDILTKYETLIKFWPPNTLDIGMKRLTGSPVQHVISSRPRSAPELYAELMALHGQHEEAKYEIKIYDSNGKEFRGSGQITLPDTRPKQGQGPMTSPQYPYGYPPQYPPPQGQIPAGYPPAYAAPYSAPPAPQTPAYATPQQPAPQPQQMPPHVPQPPSGPDPIAMMQQMFQMFQQMRESLAAQQPQAQPPPPVPPPPQHTDPGAVMGWMQQMFQMLQQMQPQPQMPQQPARRGEQPQQQYPQVNPMAAMMGMPPMTPPPGTMWIPGFGFAPIDRVTQLFSAGDSRPQGPMYRGGGAPYRPTYGGGAPGGGEERPHYGPGYQPQAPQRQPTAAEQFKESMAFIKMASDAVSEFASLIPGGGAQEPQQPHQAEDDDSPVQVIDAGPAKVVINKQDGSLRGWETGFANMDKIFKWVGEQREAIQKSHADAERQRVQAQLPPGHVLVTPGYEPPAGYVVVPVEQPQQSGLPPPPANMPPPIEPTSAPRRPWGMPPMPEGENG